MQEDNVYCGSGKSFHIIGVNGDVYRCYHRFLDPACCIGNIHAGKAMPMIKDNTCRYGVSCLKEICRVGCDGGLTMKFDLSNRVPVFKDKYINPYHAHARSIDEMRSGIGHVFLHMTNACNFRCVYCTFPHATNPLHLQDAEETLRMLSDSFPDSVVVILTGGEPTVHPRFMKVMATLHEISHGRKGKFMFSVISNMSVLDKWKEIAKMKWETPFEVQASCHFSEPPRRFNLDRFIEACKYARCCHENMSVPISFVAHPKETNNEQYRALFAKHGFHKVFCQGYEPRRARKKDDDDAVFTKL